MSYSFALALGMMLAVQFVFMVAILSVLLAYRGIIKDLQTENSAIRNGCAEYVERCAKAESMLVDTLNAGNTSRELSKKIDRYFENY